MQWELLWHCVIMGILFPQHKESYLAVLYWPDTQWYIIYITNFVIGNIFIYMLPITKFVIFFWASVSGQVCQVWELWDKNWYRFTWGLKRLFWCNFHYCVDTTSNITSQRAFYNISRLLTYLVHLFRLLSVWK